MFNKENFERGIAFEKYIIDLFEPSHFNIHSWNRDNSKIINRKIETDSDPDITVRHLTSNTLISIECKFKSNIHNNKVRLAYDNQIIHYQQYALINKIPTFVVLGLGNTPENPDRMFCIPIDQTGYTYPSLSYLQLYERPPNKPFTWINNNLV